jgi:hypothetical protein
MSYIANDIWGGVAAEPKVRLSNASRKGVRVEDGRGSGEPRPQLYPLTLLSITPVLMPSRARFISRHAPPVRRKGIREITSTMRFSDI